MASVRYSSPHSREHWPEGLVVAQFPHERPYPWLDVLAHRLVAGLVDRAYVETTLAVPAVVAAYPRLRGKISVVPFGSYASLYPGKVTMRDARKRLGLPSDATVWLAFGLIRRYKQVPELITTFAETFGADPNRILLVAGEPHNALERSRIERATAGTRNVVLRLERVPEQDVATLLAAANYVGDLLVVRDLDEYKRVKMPPVVSLEGAGRRR